LRLYSAPCTGLVGLERFAPQAPTLTPCPKPVPQTCLAGWLLLFTGVGACAVVHRRAYCVPYVRV
jgi:hypothetical protein